MKRTVFFVILIALLIVVQVFIGTPITLFLSITIIGSILYYIASMLNEQSMERTMQQQSNDDEVFKKFMSELKNKRFMLFSISLLSIVFLGSMYCIKKVVNPTKEISWFLNSDHHAVRNTAISFRQKAEFKLENSLEDSNSSIVSFEANKDRYSLNCSNVYTPIFQYDDKSIQHLVNPIYNKEIVDNFSLSNSFYVLKVNIKSISKRLWYKPWAQQGRTRFAVYLKCKNASKCQELGMEVNYQDSFSFETAQIKKGILLSRLLSDNSINIKGASSQLLQEILNDLGETYLIANSVESNVKSYNLFPSRELVTNEYQLLVDKQIIPSKVDGHFSFESKAPFFIGFGNHKNLMSLDTLQSSHAIKFDFPTSYYLTSPEEKVTGIKRRKFITNQLSQLIETNQAEGLFYQNSSLTTKESIFGTLEYLDGHSNDLFSGTIIDYNSMQTTPQKIEKGQFSLKSNGGSLTYHFDLRNFAENGFSFNYLLKDGIYLFLLFSTLMIFKRGKKLERIEPIIWSVIYTLIMLRFVLYWRLATFPPLDHISKYELEKTLIGFDFSLLGFAIPFPSTLFFITIIVLFIFMYRIGKVNIERWPSFNLNILRLSKMSVSKRLLIQYGFFLLCCLLVDFFVKVDFLKRLVTILFPLMMYSFFSIQLNTQFIEKKYILQSDKKGGVNYLSAFLHYFINNPTFFLTLLTILFFGIVDRGFCVLFILFILLKNVLLNFLKKSYQPSTTNLLSLFLKPWHFWIYGVISLLIYLIVLSFKSLFYYLLIYKLLVIGAILLLVFLVIHLLFRHQKRLWKVSLFTCVGYFILLIVPASNKFLDHHLTDKIKFVQHRASIIHQPISKLLEQNPYSSFNTKKIIETAENQWFINSYINKKFDNQTPINFRKFSKIGVNYNTQTRDVVVARFIIGEMGGYTMALILGLFIVPLFIYLLSYRLSDSKVSNKFNIETYGGLIPLLMLFTISLFVWLTSTNRFVFFGQDFPFLSLTSRLSVLMPLVLFSLVLIRKPESYNSLTINFKLGALRYILLLLAIILFGFATIKNNELKQDKFSVIVQSTKSDIDNKFNVIVQEIQDSVSSKKRVLSYESLARIIKEDRRYKSFRQYECNDIYTKSIFDAWEKNPSSAMQLHNPLYFRFDEGVYQAEYNNNLYLDLPVTESKEIWHGSLVENSINSNDQVTLNYGKRTLLCTAPYFDEDAEAGVQVAILPNSWLVSSDRLVGLVNVNNQYKKKSSIQILKASSSNQVQSSTNFVHSIELNDQAIVHTNERNFPLSLSANSQSYAFHKWVNNEYRAIFPQRNSNFWLYHFVNTIKPLYKAEVTKQIELALDYRLGVDIQQKLNAHYAKLKKKRNLSFSVIAADGNGNIRVMNDYKANRKPLDPNDKGDISRLQQQHFFYSHAKNERDQWGNANLLNLHFGPGSSIKPLVMAVVSSQVNAGWEHLNYLPTQKQDKETYAGLKLSHPWKDDEHYFATPIDIPTYLQHSSNYFHSVIMFLGSYKRSSFSSDTMSLKNVLTLKAGANNSFPKLLLKGQPYSLPNYNSGNGNWPASSENKLSKSFFANENSILANGLNLNANLITSDIDKMDGTPLSTQKTYFVDSNLQKKLISSNPNNAIWSLPEASMFPQKMRHYISSKKRNEINENFNLGLKTATLGGYPYQITPFKMLEMYNSLFTFNRAYTMQIMPTKTFRHDWQIDSSWNVTMFKNFLAENVFEGMRRVIAGGTANKLNGLAIEHPSYFFYAKTGTINEEGGRESSSKRLILSITNADMTKAEHIGGNTKVYSWYFVADSQGDFNWELLKEIVNTTMASTSFKHYFAN